MLTKALQGTLSRAQVSSIVKSQRRINLWTGAIRSGKTIASLLRWLLFIAREAPEGGHLVIVGKTLQTIERNVIETLQDRALFGELADQTHHTPGASVAVILGRRVHLIGANDVKAFGKLRGMTCAGAYVDEASLLPPGFFAELLGRLSLRGARLFGTTNPDGPAHWLKVEYLDRQSDLDLAHFRFTLDDNESLDPDYVRSIKAEYVGLWFRRLILGEWVAAEGTVYDAWAPDTMVVDTLPKIARWFSLGLDYGTTNPLDAVLVGRADDGRLYVGAEWRWSPQVQKRRLTDTEHSQYLREWLAQLPREDGTTQVGVRPDWVCVDPSAASFIEQLHADKVHGVTDADNSVVDGIRTVASLMATDRLRVHASCRALIDELAGYSWDDKATARGEDKPMKVADHAVDALRYALHTTEALWRPHVRRAAA